MYIGRLVCGVCRDLAKYLNKHIDRELFHGGYFRTIGLIEGFDCETIDVHRNDTKN